MWDHCLCGSTISKRGVFAQQVMKKCSAASRMPENKYRFPDRGNPDLFTVPYLLIPAKRCGKKNGRGNDKNFGDQKRMNTELIFPKDSYPGFQAASIGWMGSKRKIILYCEFQLTKIFQN